MRRKIILGGAAAAGLSLGGIGRAQSQQTQTLEQASKSVLKIVAGTSAASGFIWPDSQHIVTSLHVVDSAPSAVAQILDSMGKIESSFSLTVARVLKSADLVLLKISETLDRAPLQLSTNRPAVKQSMDALGFPLNINGVSSTEVKIRFGGNRLETILPPKILRAFTDYPSKSLEILNLEGSLVPGLSGAPILDNKSKVVGIGNGGLEAGAINICWAIPSSNLEKLAQSTVTTLPRSPVVKELFSADIDSNVKSQTAEGISLTRVRTRTFAELASSADDQLGLSQLANNFGAFSPNEFRYDVYQDARLGGAVAVPEGALLIKDGDFIVVKAKEWPRISAKIQLLPADGRAHAQSLSERFELKVTRIFEIPQRRLDIDPAWSLAGALKRGDVWVNRKALARSDISQGFAAPDAYFFETVASTEQAFLGVVAIINANFAPRTFAEQRAWAQLVLGVQFSTLPPSVAQA